MPENTPFDAYIGTFQGRLQPTLASPSAGSYVWTLGFDGARAEALAFNDYIEVSQSIDVTGITFLGVRAWVKQPKDLISRRSLTTGAVIISTAASTITNIVPASGGLGPIITTQVPHYLLAGTEVVIGNVVWSGVPAVANKRTRIRSVVSPTQIELDTINTGSGTYAGGGSLGLGERFLCPVGFALEDVGRTFTVANSGVPANNGTYKILGLFKQPAQVPTQQVWVERPSGSALTYETTVMTPALQVDSPGARWKVSLHVHDGSSLREMARVVQKSTQSPFFRADMKAYVRQLTGNRQFTVRLTLIQSATNDLYSLPP